MHRLIKATCTIAAEEIGRPGALHMASGFCELPLSADMRRGDIVISDEIMHGLGKGSVLVQVGLELIAEDYRMQKMGKSTIYGDPSLFRSEKLPLSYVDTAVRVMNDRGSFQVAARLKRETGFVVLPLRWTAIRLPDEATPAQEPLPSDYRIEAIRPTVVLAPRESCSFDVRFCGMEPCALCYELVDGSAGEISPAGVYTAPAREGVYEIRISCRNEPEIETYVYAVVKKKQKKK